MLILLFLTAFLIFANGFFVAAEFALVKVRSTQLEVREEAGERMAGVARELVEHLDGYLSATQLGITLTSLGLGWIGEPAVAALLGPVFHALHLPEEVSHKVAVVVGFTVISFLHIVLGEVAPKSYAIARPVQTSMWVALPMKLFHTMFYPALVVLNASSNLLLRLVGIQEGNSHSLAVPADELVRIAAESAAGGHISEGEGKMLSNVFAFSHRLAREIMVPRNRVAGFDVAAADLDAEIQRALDAGHSRYPVFEGELENVVGMLHLMDLLRLPDAERTLDTVRSLMRPALLVPESLPAEKVMRRMQVRRSHLAIVIDEHGVVAGVVSLEDALEELVGEIQDEHDDEAGEIRQTDTGFEFSGVLNLDEMCAALEVPDFESDADTLQGWLMETLERLPVVGDTASLGPWKLVVTEVDQRAVQQVDATRSAMADGAEDQPS
jgi:CBS domain containing-hemolysin-like protein